MEYAPWWVRVLSAACLGLGTMIGYRRIVRTLVERVGRTHLTLAQGASAELVGAGLIASAGFTGLPVSTTHIITSGTAGTMIGAFGAEPADADTHCSSVGINPARHDFARRRPVLFPRTLMKSPFPFRLCHRSFTSCLHRPEAREA